MRLLTSIKEYAKIGLILGAALAVLASVRLITNGPAFFRERLGVPYLAVVGLYLAGGVITCVMLAIFEGRAKSLLSYIVMGVIVAAPGSALLTLALTKPEHSFHLVLFVAAGMAIIYGTIGGIMAWWD
jgi:hypothetical protein